MAVLKTKTRIKRFIIDFYIGVPFSEDVFLDLISSSRNKKYFKLIEVAPYFKLKDSVQEKTESNVTQVILRHKPTI